MKSLKSILIASLLSISTAGYASNGAVDSGGTGSFKDKCKFLGKILASGQAINATSISDNTPAELNNTAVIEILSPVDVCPNMLTGKDFIFVDISKAEGQIINGGYYKYPAGAKVKLEVTIIGDPRKGIFTEVKLLKILSLER